MSKQQNKTSQSSNGVLVEIGRRVRTLPKATKHGCEVGELCEITHLSRSQIAFYEKTGLLGPAFRKYSPDRPKRPQVYYKEADVLKALIISDLRDSDFPVQQLRKLIKNLQALGFSFDWRTNLLTNGRSIFVAATPTEVIDVLKQNRQMLLLVSIEDQVQKVNVSSA